MMLKQLIHHYSFSPLCLNYWSPLSFWMHRIKMVKSDYDFSDFDDIPRDVLPSPPPELAASTPGRGRGRGPWNSPPRRGRGFGNSPLWRGRGLQPLPLTGLCLPHPIVGASAPALGWSRTSHAAWRRGCPPWITPASSLISPYHPRHFPSSPGYESPSTTPPEIHLLTVNIPMIHPPYYMMDAPPPYAVFDFSLISGSILCSEWPPSLESATPPASPLLSESDYFTDTESEVPHHLALSGRRVDW